MTVNMARLQIAVLVTGVVGAAIAVGVVLVPLTLAAALAAGRVL